MLFSFAIATMMLMFIAIGMPLPSAMGRVCPAIGRVNRCPVVVCNGISARKKKGENNKEKEGKSPYCVFVPMLHI